MLLRFRFEKKSRNILNFKGLVKPQKIIEQTLKINVATPQAIRNSKNLTLDQIYPKNKISQIQMLYILTKPQTAASESLTYCEDAYLQFNQYFK